MRTKTMHKTWLISRTHSSKSDGDVTTLQHVSINLNHVSNNACSNQKQETWLISWAQSSKSDVNVTILYFKTYLFNASVIIWARIKYSEHFIGGQRLVRIAPSSLPPHCCSPVTRSFISVEASSEGVILNSKGGCVHPDSVCAEPPSLTAHV